MATMCVEEVLQQLSDIDTDISSDEPDGSSSSSEESDMLEYSSEECDEMRVMTEMLHVLVLVLVGGEW